MTYVVTEPCIKCKFTDCIDSCPAECFHEGKNMLVIDPAECIDCGACEPECPTSAIYAEGDVPPQWSEYVQLNAKLASQWPVLNEKRSPLPGAESQKESPGKRPHLIFAPGP